MAWFGLISGRFGCNSSMIRYLTVSLLNLAMHTSAQTSATHSAPVRKAVASHAAELTIDQAFARVRQLPEIKAWFEYVEAHGSRPLLADMESHPIRIHGVRYHRINFMENNEVNAHRWESFVVRLRDGAVFVDSGMDGESLRTLSEWRRDDHPLDRIKPPLVSATAAAEPPPYMINNFDLHFMGSGSSASDGVEFVTINVEVQGTPGASATGRFLTLTIGKGDSRRMTRPPLAEETKPIGPLDAQGKTLIQFKVPLQTSKACGRDMLWATISGQTDNAKQTGFMILDCL